VVLGCESLFSFTRPERETKFVAGQLGRLAPVSVVKSPDLRYRYHAPPFRRFHFSGVRGVFAQG
jgi:hypothetical protein